MTREEAIKQVEVIRACMIVDDAEPSVVEALNMAVEALEQEPILDKIRAEIIEDCGYSKDYVGTFDYTTTYLKIVLQIIDKYTVGKE